MNLSACAGGTCDDCGKKRRTLYVAGVNQWDGVVEHAICFFCAKSSERKAKKQEMEMYARWAEEDAALSEADDETGLEEEVA